MEKHCYLSNPIAFILNLRALFILILSFIQANDIIQKKLYFIGLKQFCSMHSKLNY